MARFPAHMGRWLRSAHSLLAPRQEKCLACGRPGQLSALLPGICEACVRTVPWISKPRCRKCGRHVGCPDCARGNDASALICNRSAVAYSSEMRVWLGQYKYRGDERYAEALGVMLDRAYLMLEAEMESRERTNPKPEHWNTAPSRNPAEQRVKGSLLSWLNSQWGAALRSRVPGAGTASASSRGWKADLLVPVPVSDIRLAERGFNQAERLTRFISARRNIPVMELLARAHHTSKQSFKTRAERLADMKRVFVPNPVEAEQFSRRLLFSGNSDSPIRALPPSFLPPVQIIVVDDIYTTGSTIRACADALQEIAMSSGCRAEVYSLTWARS
ncbi:putative amidophosphoribosyltransferase [Paenibacillus forsythiae]|uniref:Amidophosphoribosyltransferase n=1 Tax=Paenibacillus forsythiae TaxID=365616 RepID=A0ABU3HB18_9BACL|nr:ComF family protein [Paenibacillus forsythiae]MDT3428018.1 putative amidophosphoribosyltransferase [Paenibacillus forsythiae]